jgi:hypothetical protein
MGAALRGTSIPPACSPVSLSAVGIDSERIQPVGRLVEHVRVEVGVVGPDDGAGLGVDPDLREEGRVFVGSEHAPPVADAGSEVDTETVNRVLGVPVSITITATWSGTGILKCL